MPEWVHTLTVDASHVERLGVTGIGIVVQERGSGRRRGPVVDQISELHPGVSASVCEAFAILRALEIALDRGYSRVKVRSDYNGLRRQLRERHRSGMPATSFICIEILALAKRFTWVDFGYVARRKNQLAHRLARAAWSEHRHRIVHSNVGQRTASELDVVCADLWDDDDAGALELPF